VPRPQPGLDHKGPRSRIGGPTCLPCVSRVSPVCVPCVSRVSPSSLFAAWVSLAVPRCIFPSSYFSPSLSLFLSALASLASRVTLPVSPSHASVFFSLGGAQHRTRTTKQGSVDVIAAFRHGFFPTQLAPPPLLGVLWSTDLRVARCCAFLLLDEFHRPSMSSRDVRAIVLIALAWGHS
jgi:hypothetical protein